MRSTTSRVSAAGDADRGRSRGRGERDGNRYARRRERRRAAALGPDRRGRRLARTISGTEVTSARNLPGWEGTFPLGETLGNALGTEIRIGNDVQVATDAEFKLGAGRLYTSLLESSGAPAWEGG